MVWKGAGGGLLKGLCANARARYTVVTEKLNDAGVRHIARSLDLNLRGVECDAQGMLPDALEVACQQENVAAILVTPTNHNPTNASMPLARRAAIVEIAGRDRKSTRLNSGPNAALVCPLLAEKKKIRTNHNLL